MNKNDISYALSDSDMMRLLHNKCNIMEYGQLYNYNSLDDVLGKFKTCIILYNTSTKIGHWTCIFLRKDNILEFFDPYGIIIDNEIKGTFMDPEWIKNYYRDGEKRLSHLIINSKYNSIEYNNYNIQSKDKGINTCGRHVVCRLWNKHLSLDDYYNIIQLYNPDELVVELTNKHL